MADGESRGIEDILRDLAREMAQLYRTPEDAHGLLRQAQFPQNREPQSYPNMAVFWTEIVDIVDSGVSDSLALSDMVEIALVDWPGNRVLRALSSDLRRHFNEMDPIVAGAIVPTPLPETIGAHSANRRLGFSLSVTTEQPPNVVEPALRNEMSRLGLSSDIENVHQSGRVLMFNLPGLTPDDAGRLGSHLRATGSFLPGLVSDLELTSNAHRDIVYRQLTAVGPDQTPWTLTNVPGSTPVRTVGSAIMNKLSPSVRPTDSQGAQRQTVVDLQGPEGEMRRLSPDDTLENAGVRDGDYLHVHPEARAGADLNQGVIDEACVRFSVEIEAFAESADGRAAAFRYVGDAGEFSRYYEIWFDVPSLGPPEVEGGRPTMLGAHHVVIDLNTGFPNKAPEIRWLPQIIYHPNVDQRFGKVCLGAMEEFFQSGMEFRRLFQFLIDVAAYRQYAVVEEGFYNRSAAEWVFFQPEESAAMISAIGGVAYLVRLKEGGYEIVDGRLQPKRVEIDENRPLDFDISAW